MAADRNPPQGRPPEYHRAQPAVLKAVDVRANFLLQGPSVGMRALTLHCRCAARRDRRSTWGRRYGYLTRPVSVRRPAGSTIHHAVSLVALLFCACAVPPDDVMPPGSCGPQREFSVVGHGWHTGVVVRARDLEERLPELADSLSAASLVELGWGDAAFYRAPEPTMSLALRAVLYPTDAVLHIVAIPNRNLRAHFPDSTVVTVTVPASGYGRLLDHLVETFARTPDGGLIALEPGLYGRSRFYRAEGLFYASNTCNTWVARAVAATGYPLRKTTVITADGLLNELHRATDTPCYVSERKRDPARK